jgi:hypothetical protein
MRLPVLFGGRPLSDYDAKMQSYPYISSREVDAEVFQGADRSAMQLLKNRRGSRYLTCRIDFFGKSNFLRTLHQSEFEALFLGADPVEIDINDGYFYRAVLVAVENSETESEYITTVEYRFQVTRHTAEVTVRVIPSDELIYCQSNVAKTDCKIRIIFSELDDAVNTVVGLGRNFVLPNLWSFAPELTGDLVIDGINKVFTMGGVNVTSKMSWSDFPYLLPGNNLLTLSVDGVVIGQRAAEVTYTPTFL